MHTMRKVLALMLVLCTTLSFAACVGEAGDPLDNASTPKLGFDDSDDANTDEDSYELVITDDVTATPIITFFVNKDVDDVIVCGVCEENSVITAEGFGLTSSASVNAKGGIFAIPVNLINDSVTLDITAKVEGKEASASVKQVVNKAEGESGDKITPVVVSDRFVLFNENSLKLLTDTSNSFGKESALTTSIAGLNVGSGDTEIIYVLAPSRESVMKDALPEGYEHDNLLLNQTIKAITEVDKDYIHFIDLRDAFANANDYPLFYDTYSGWTDYAAYIAYTEIMNYIAKKFPDAAPHGMDQFDVNEVDAYLGDLADALGIDTKLFTEKVYDFVPKFDLDIGNEYAVNKQEVPVYEVSEESNDDDELASGYFEEDLPEVIVSEDVIVDEPSEESSEDAEEESEEEESEELDEDFLATFSLISDLRLTVGEKDYRFYTKDTVKDYLFYHPEENESPKTLDENEFCFGTNRNDLYLPSALIYRSSNTSSIMPLLAERFRNSVFAKPGLFNIQGTKAKDYAGTPGNTNVDYIIVIITEEDLAQLYK